MLRHRERSRAAGEALPGYRSEERNLDYDTGMPLL